MDLSIYKNKQARGCFFQKGPRVGSSKTKRLAMVDINKECGPFGFFTQSYINREAEVLASLKFDFKYIPINNEDTDSEPYE